MIKINQGTLKKSPQVSIRHIIYRHIYIFFESERFSLICLSVYNSIIHVKIVFIDFKDILRFSSSYFIVNKALYDYQWYIYCKYILVKNKIEIGLYWILYKKCICVCKFYIFCSTIVLNMLKKNLTKKYSKYLYWKFHGINLLQ